MPSRLSERYFPYTIRRVTMNWIGALILAIPVVVCCGCRSDAGSQRSGSSSARNLALPQEVFSRLAEAGWTDRVGSGLGIWVSVKRQKLIGIENGTVRFFCICSTAAKGTGNRAGSNATPLGWHCIDERYGDGLPAGAVFKERRYVDRVWKPGQETKDDLILSRILWLRGLEQSVNVGPGIDSHARYIYIHGTPEEHRLGSPVSMGCIRLSNQDVIAVFDRVQSGTPLLITEW